MSPASPRPTSSSTTKHVQDDHRPHQHPQPRPCRFFRSRGGCRAGEACRFAHVAPPPRGAADEHDGAHGGRRGGGEAHEKKPHPVPHPQPPKGGKTSRNHRPAGVGARPPPPPRGAEQPPATPSTTPAVAVGAGAEAAVEAVVDVGEGVAPAAAAVPSPARDAHKQKHPQQQQPQRRRRKKSNQGQRAAQSPAPSQSPSPAPRVSTASASPKTVTCRYGPDCTIPNCGLRHSPDSSADRGHARGQTSRRGGVGNDGDGGEEASAGVPSPGPSGSGGLGSPPPVPAPADSPAPSPARMKGVQQQHHHQQQRQRGQARGARNAAAVIPCRFFFSRGGSCARGASCKFSHVAASSGREESERRGAGAGADGDGAAAASAETFDHVPTGPGDARAAHGGDVDVDAHEPGGPDDGGEAIAIVDEHERPERARGGGGDDDDHAEARTKGKPGQRQHKYERDCNFGERCKRRHCKYTHPNGRAIDRKQHQQQQQQKQSRIDGGVDASTAEAPLPPPRTAKIDPHSNDKHHNHNHDDDDLHIIHNDQSGNRNSNRTTSQADGGANDDTLAPIVPGAKAQHQKQPHRLRGNQERGEGRGRGARGKDASTSNMDEDYGKMNNNERSNNNNNNNNNTNNGRRADGANSHGQGADDAAEGTRRDLSSRAGHRAAGSGAAASRGMTIEKGAKAMATPTASPTATVRDGPSTTLRAKPGQPNVVLDSRVGEEGLGVGVGVSAADGPGDGDRGGKENVSHPRHNHPDKRKRGKKQRQQSAGVVDVDNRRSGEEEKKEMHPRDDHVGGGLVVPPPVERGSGDAEKATHAATTSKPQSVPFEDDAKTQGKPRTPTRPQEEGPWACARCTLINPASTARCEVCHFDPKSDSDATTAGGPADARPNKDEETPEPTNKAGPNEWACRQCTLLNPKGRSRCGACERPRSPSTNDPHPPGGDDAAGRDAKPQTAVASDSNRPKGKPTADVEAKAKTKTGKNTTGKRAVGGVATHPIAREHPKSREEALEPAVRHLATLAQSSTLASAFERWTAYARERRAEDERANIREKMRRERENAQKRREEKKNKKRERWLREQEEQERVRRQFWEKEMAHEEEHVALLVELCVAEFVRQADDSKTEVTADTVKSDPSARSKLLYCCRRVYRQLFGDRGNRNVTVVDIQNKALHGRTGTIQYYDDDKGKFCVGLDTKKGKKAEMCFIKPGSLDVITRSKAAEQRKTSSATAEYHLEVPALYLGFDLIMSVSKSDVEAMKANGLDLRSYLDQLMERRDKEDNLRREEVKKAQRLQEERKKEDAKRRARMNEEWEEEKQRRDRDKAAREEMKRERRRHQRAGHSSPFQRRGPEAFFGGGMGGPTFVFSNGRGFVFFGGYDDFFDDEEDFFDHDGRFYDDEDSEEEREAARKEHAEVLGVAENASAQEIRSAYRKQALIYHPDKFKADAAGGMTKEAAEEHFKKMNNAYESLLGGFDN